MIWTRQTGTSGDDYGYGVSIGTDGNVYVAGSASGSLNGQPWGGDKFTVTFVIDFFFKLIIQAEVILYCSNIIR